MKDSISYISAIVDSISPDSLHRDSFPSGPLAGELTGFAYRDAADLYKAETVEVDKSRHEGNRMPFTIEQTDGVFGLLLLCFLFFTHIYNGGYTFLKENISLLFTFDKKERIHRQTTSKEALYSYFLVFQAVVLMAIAIYDIFIETNSSVDGVRRPFVTILLFMVLIGLFFGIKDFIYRILGYVFDQGKQMAIWRRICVIAIEILGILYFIPTLLLVYSQYYHWQIIIFMIILFLFVQILLFYQIIIFFIREKFNFLYLIAYLCTFEILPYIFLLVGLAYLYRIDVFNTLWL